MLTPILSVLRRLLLALTAMLPCLAAHAATSQGTPYAIAGSCEGLPRVALNTVSGFCVGLAASNLGMPRGVLPLADGSALVTDMGGWGKNKGRLLRLVRHQGGFDSVTLLSGLDRPHGLQLGPDGQVYLGEAGRISRFNPTDAQPILVTVIDKLPDDGRHPIKVFVFGKDGALYVNFGSATDNCEGHIDTSQSPLQQCTDMQTNPQRASIWRYTEEDGQWQGKQFAGGLRNSMALAIHPATGALWQAENSRDYINRKMPGLKSDENLPHEELNLIHEGSNYGWPYCYDNNQAAPEFPQADCGLFARPVMLLPGHAAPLGMAFYDQPGGLAAWRGSLIMGWHGYRNNGHRLVAIRFDSSGMPQGQPQELISDWGDVPGKHPMGAPTDIKIDKQGAIWMTEDRNGDLLIMAPIRVH
ncbi:PQQ-dependent sugar dehydrogenase [Silvimonas amylolytica]|uniref:Pyrroloquinoline quinone-dependent pyranose dehydrogenase beta-propeller domain-containing protein n=1 Tax=Silvimonas amylolytica TaxID=449663 RepID=A0ABQ2PFX0_9NEIS|nr:PQQ-dependent sugar dehydrogenase [Silvimonas amylolytica]GGP24228.1 hypothetical protein GCM10010971_00470 [Silvimonas amylolytica]